MIYVFFYSNMKPSMNSSQKCLKCLEAIEPTQNYYGLHRQCFLTWFEITEPKEFSGLARKPFSKDPDSKDRFPHDNSSFFHGKFRKYSADLAEVSYIMKVKESEAPELPDVEYLSNQIAETLGLPVAKFYLIEFSGERAFITKNFIEKKTNANLCHIYHYQKDKINRDCETLIDIISEETKQYRDIEIFINACLFDSLIGNHDRHGRNIGLLVTPKGARLAPIYDNPSALGLESGDWLKADFSPKGRIPTKETNEPTAKDYVIEFERLGYLEEVRAFSRRVDLLKINTLTDLSFCSDPMKNAIKNLVRKRHEEISNELSKGS